MTLITQCVGDKLKVIFHAEFPLPRPSVKAVNANTNAAYGNVAFGNTHYAMSAII